MKLRTSLPQAERGQVMLIALGMLAVLAMISGYTLTAMSSRYKTALRTAAWEESLLVAESGVDMVVAQVAGLLPDVSLNKNGLSLGVTTQPSLALLTGLKLEPGGLNLMDGITIALTPDPLVHGGEGANTSSATVSIDVLPLDQILNGQLLSGVLGLLSANQPSTVNLLRLRSKGTVYLAGSSRTADVSSLDTQLMKLALIRDPKTGQKVTKPFVSREVQVLLKPVFPFAYGVATNGPLTALNSLTSFDSFNSSSPSTSTNGLFDTAKLRQNIQMSVNNATVQLGGIVHGDLSTSGGTVVKDSHVTGRVNNAYFRPLTSPTAPTWSGSNASISGTTTISSGLLSVLPTQYKFSNVTSGGTIRVTSPLGAVGSLLGGILGGVPVVGDIASSQADIYVTGDFRGKIIVDPGVKVRLFVRGDIVLGADGIQNQTQRAANLQILGVAPTGNSNQTMSIDTTKNPIAAIYTPTHDTTLTGNGGLSGALTVAQLIVSGAADVHFDEALALLPSFITGYELVSWQEIQTP